MAHVALALSDWSGAATQLFDHVAALGCLEAVVAHVHAALVDSDRRLWVLPTYWSILSMDL